MHPQRVTDNEVPPISDRPVGARGPNAARRAAQAFDVTSVSRTNANNDDNASQPVAELRIKDGDRRDPEVGQRRIYASVAG